MSEIKLFVTKKYAAKDVSGQDEIEFWTSATDKSCSGRFTWCSSYPKLVPKWIWKENEPGRNNCAVATLPQPEESGVYMEVTLATRDCNYQAFFICAVREILA